MQTRFKPLTYVSVILSAIAIAPIAAAAPLSASLTAHQQRALRSLGIKIVVPGYVPPGFRLDYVRIEPCPAGVARSAKGVCRFGPGYGIVYRNPSNACFTIEAVGGGVGGPAFDYAVPVRTPLFGEVALQFGQQAATSQMPTPPQLATPQKNLFMDWGGDGPFYRLIGADFTRSEYYSERPNRPATACRNDITPNEAAQIVRSLEWLK